MRGKERKQKSRKFFVFVLVFSAFRTISKTKMRTFSFFCFFFCHVLSSHMALKQKCFLSNEYNSKLEH
jgi:hypothetical protein